MKHSLSLLLCFICSLYISATIIHHKSTFSTSEITLYDIKAETPETQIIWADLSPSGNSGDLALPVKFINIAVPCGATNLSIKNLHTHKSNIIALKHPITKISITKTDGTTEEAPKSTSSNSLLNKAHSQVTIVGHENYNDVKDIVTIRIEPLLYDDKGYTLQPFTCIEFDLSYEEPNGKKLSASAPMTDEYVLKNLSIINHLVENSDDIKSEIKSISSVIANKAKSDTAVNRDRINRISVKALGLPVYEYVIITSQELAPAFERLANIKRIQGLDVGIVCMEEILNNPLYANGDTISNIIDDAGKLRKYLGLAWERGCQYVLLGGKPPIVPVRYGINRFSTSVYDRPIPTDLYYANVRDNWDKNHNGIPGQIDGSPNDTISVVPQLFVGRIPCKTAQEVINYTNKLEDYLFNPGNGDPSYLRKGFMHFTYQFYVRDDSDFDCPLETSAYVRKHFLDLTESFQSEGKPSGTDIINTLANENFGFFSIFSHGNPEGVGVNYHYPNWGNCKAGINALNAEFTYHPYEDGNGLDNLSNIHYPSVSYSIACSNMAYDSPKLNGYGRFDPAYDNLTYNFGESYILGQNYGGVAFMGYTRNGYLTYSPQLMGEFFKLLNEDMYDYGTLSHCGAALAASKCMSFSGGGKKYCGLSNNLLGDPHLRIWGNSLPKTCRNYSVDDTTYGRFSISDTTSQIKNTHRWLVAIEPNSAAHKYRFSDNAITISGLNPSSIFYVIEDGYLPWIGNARMRDVTLDSIRYFRANNLDIGGSVINNKPIGPATIKKGSNITFDISDTTVLRDAITVEEGATLTILTKNLLFVPRYISGKGKINIYADSVKFANNGFYVEGELNIYKYNKYYEQKQELIYKYTGNSYHRTKAKLADYSPMLEAGKTWKYNRFYQQIYSPGDDGTPYQYKLGEPVNVGDKQIYPLYTKDIPDPEDTNYIVAYLWEDIEAKKVYQLPTNIINTGAAIPDAGFLLYDFAEPLNFEALANSSIQFNNYCAHPTTYTSLDNKEHNAWFCFTSHDALLAEGLGFVDSGKFRTFGENATIYIYTDLLWGMAGTPTGDGLTSALYEIVDGEGKMIYSLKEAYPHYRTGIAATGEDAIGIEVLPGAVTISSNRPIGDIAIISTSGAVVKAVSAPSSKCEIPLDGIEPGIYILRAGKESRKIVVK